MRKFDTDVQYLKYRVLREVARHAFAGTLVEGMYTIPKTIVPGKDATMRCCVYKERAIVEERIKVAMGGCIGGPCNLTHEVKDKKEVDDYGKLASVKTITESIEAFK